MEKIAQERDDYRQQYNDLQRSEKEFDQMQLEVLNVKKREEAARYGVTLAGCLRVDGVIPWSLSLSLSSTALSNVEQSHQSLHKELMQHVEAFEKEKSRLQFELERQQQNAEQAASRFQSQVDEQAGEVQALTAQLEQVVATAKKVCCVESYCTGLV